MSGEWSYTTNNGGFHVLKSDIVTLSFYPSSKTINVQGALKDVVKKDILMLIFSSEMEDSRLIDVDKIDSQAEAKIKDGGGGVEGEEEMPELFDHSKDVRGNHVVGNTQSFTDINISNCKVESYDYNKFPTAGACQSCLQNTRVIEELMHRMDMLERKVDSSANPKPYDELLSKYNWVVEERDRF